MRMGVIWENLGANITAAAVLAEARTLRTTAWGDLPVCNNSGRVAERLAVILTGRPGASITFQLPQEGHDMASVFGSIHLPDSVLAWYET